MAAGVLAQFSTAAAAGGPSFYITQNNKYVSIYLQEAAAAAEIVDMATPACGITHTHRHTLVTAKRRQRRLPSGGHVKTRNTHTLTRTGACGEALLCPCLCRVRVHAPHTPACDTNRQPDRRTQTLVRAVCCRCCCRRSKKNSLGQAGTPRLPRPGASRGGAPCWAEEQVGWGRGRWREKDK